MENTYKLPEAIRNNLVVAEDIGQEFGLLQKINQTIDLDHLLTLLAQEIEDLGLFDAYLINIADKNRENLVCEKIHLPENHRVMEKTYQKYHFSIEGDFVNINSFLKNDVLFLDANKIQEYDEATQNRFYRWEIQELVAIPIPGPEEGRPIGSILAYRTSSPLEKGCAERLQKIIHPFRFQLSHAREYNELKSRETQIDQVASEQTRFMQFVTVVNSLTKTEEIYDIISHEFLRQLPFEHISIHMRVGDKIMCKRNTIKDETLREFCTDWDEFLMNTPYNIDEKEGATAISFSNNIHLLIPDVMKIRHLPMSEKDSKGISKIATPRTFFMMPIRHNNRPIGLVRLISFTKTVDVSENELKFVELLCRFIGTAIRNAENYETVDKQKREIEQLNSNLQGKVEKLASIATHDKLTGLYNFRAFEMEIDRKIKNAAPNEGINLALIVIDIDHFKVFNDTHGHNAGNEILTGVAQTINGLTRQKDIACRYGGEEFVVILPQCGFEGAEQFSERARSAIESSRYNTEDGELGVTVSVGYGCFREGEAREKLFERVDQALYRAKNGGRNRIEEAF
ncbi:MAG: sensor domain-containing diguanylate cyclase [Agarilytica sp.]